MNNRHVFECSSWWSGTAGKESKVETEVAFCENVSADAVQLSCKALSSDYLDTGTILFSV